MPPQRDLLAGLSRLYGATREILRFAQDDATRAADYRVESDSLLVRVLFAVWMGGRRGFNRSLGNVGQFRLDVGADSRDRCDPIPVAQPHHAHALSRATDPRDLTSR